MRDAALGIIRRYDVKTPGPATPVRNLSGGNLQKLVLGREFADDPLVLVVAQPTRGLDVGAIETVHSYLREAAAKGVAILLMSEDLDEIRALADRILVVYEGEIVGELHAGAASIEEIGLLMAGGTRRREARAPSRAAVVALRPGSGRLARRRVRVMGVVLQLTGHSPWETYRKIVEAGFTGTGALSATLSRRLRSFHRTGRRCGVSHAALQHRRRGAALPRSRRSVVDRAPARRPGRDVDAAVRVAMCAAAAVLGALWALIPGVLRAFARTNEIITSLMLNYVAGLLLTYLIFDSSSYWRDTSTLQARAFPQGKPMPELRTGRRSALRSSCRSAFSSGSSPRSSSGSCTRACGSGSRSVSSPTRRARRGTRGCGRAGRSSR